MATLTRFVKTFLIYCVIIVTMLIPGCIDNADEKPVEIVPVSTLITQAKADVLVYNNSDGTLTHIFEVNDQDMMFDINVQLLGFSNEKSIALVMVDNSPHEIPYNTENMVKDHIIKITDVDDITQRAKIIVKRIE